MSLSPAFPVPLGARFEGYVAVTDGTFQAGASLHLGFDAGILAAHGYLQVDAIAQGLKNLSRDLNVPIVALAQLNREIEGRASKEPTLADLRESGGIEQAGDVILLLHRDKDNNPRDLEVHIRKNRHGDEGMFRLDFRGEYSRAEDVLGVAPPIRAV